MSRLALVLSLAWVRSGAVMGAVQEHRRDQRRGFLDAGLVLGGHAGGGLEQLAEQEEQFPGGEVAAERAVVDAALQQRPEQRPYLLFCVAGVVGNAEPADEGGVLAAAGGDYASDAGD